MVGQIQLKIFKEGAVGIVDGRRGLKTSFPNMKPRHLVNCKHTNCVALFQMGIIRVVMLWCIRCELKGLITSQAPLN